MISSIPHFAVAWKGEGMKLIIHDFSLSDAVFYIVILYLSIFHMNLVKIQWVMISIAIVIIIRVINFI